MSDDRTSMRPAEPVHFEHWCGHDGCTKWGSFGKERGRGETEWRCMEHLAADYWDGRAPMRNCSKAAPAVSSEGLKALVLKCTEQFCSTRAPWHILNA